MWMEEAVPRLMVDSQRTGTRRLAITVRLKRGTLDAGGPREGKQIFQKEITATKTSVKVIMALT